MSHCAASLIPGIRDRRQFCPRQHVEGVPKLGGMSDGMHTAPALFLLMAQYCGRTVVPIEIVARDFFGSLTVEKLLQKCLRGEIPLPILHIENSQKGQKGVHLVDLAAYIDKRRAAALKERDQLTGLR